MGRCSGGADRVSTPPLRAHAGRACNNTTQGWMRGDLPAPEDGIVDRMGCLGSNNGNDCFWQRPIGALNCGRFYVFELPHDRLCGTWCGE